MPDGIVSVPEVTGWNFLNLSTDDIFAAEEYLINNAAPTSVAWPSAGLALYIPFYIAAPGVAQGIFWQNGSAVAGNVEVALFDEDLNKIATSGLVAASGTSVPQYVAFGSPVLLPTGRYYIGVVASSGSQQFLAWTTSAAATNVNRLLGIVEQTGLGSGLVSPAVPVTSARSYMPVVGISYALVTI